MFAIFQRVRPYYKYLRYEQKPLPHAVRGLVQALAEHQVLAAKAAWEGDHRDGVRALAAHPLVSTLTVAEELYVEMAHAHAVHLPNRLVR